VDVSKARIKNQGSRPGGSMVRDRLGYNWGNA